MKRNNNETRTYVQGLRLFGKTLPNNTKKILKKNGHNYTEIIRKWNILVNNNISSASYPKTIKISPEGNGNTLILSVKRGNEILIEYSKKEIIDKINSYYGYRFIDKISLKSINSSKKENKTKHNISQFSEKFEKKINQIKNENIKKSFLKLVDAIKNE